MLLAANGPWNNSKGHLLFAGGAQCAKYLPRGAKYSARWHLRHAANLAPCGVPLDVCRLSFHGAVTSSWGGKQPMGR